MNHYKPGDVFERLTILEIIKHPKNPKALCACSCGSTCTPQLGALGNGRAKSCGCHRREMLAKSSVTHGLSKTPEYKIFQGIVARCTNPNEPAFKNYGGRGIRCLWPSFESFLADMGERPAGHWIERVDNDGHYSKANCKWVTPSENSKNKRVSKKWIVRGVEYSSSRDAATAVGVDASEINRWCNGYTRRGIHHPPKEGCSCERKYQPQT